MRPRIGLALSGGAARGWTHLGIIRSLASAGIIPDVIAGTSMGAVVGAFWAVGKLDVVEDFARSITWRGVVNFLDLSLFGSGLIGGRRLASLLRTHLGNTAIEDLDVPFVAVATDLATGCEVWLESGSLVTALTASYALPGLFCPVRTDGALLVDGAFANPLPVSACRARGADVVIGVNVNPETLPCRVVRTGEPRAEVEAAEGTGDPGLSSVVRNAFNIAICRIAQARLEDSPPDLLIRPDLGDCGYFDFHRGPELIEIGEAAGKRVLSSMGFDRAMGGTERTLVAAE